MICASKLFSRMFVYGGFVQPGGIDPNISCGFLDLLGTDLLSESTRREQNYLCFVGLWVQRKGKTPSPARAWPSPLMQIWLFTFTHLAETEAFQPAGLLRLFLTMSKQIRVLV